MSLSAFGYVYHISSTAQTVPIGSSIRFNSNGPLKNIQHSLNTSGIKVGLSGVYNIIFGINTLDGNPENWAVTVNGVVFSLFSASGKSITAATSLRLKFGDVVRIRNVGTEPNPVTLLTGSRTAWVLINKVD